MRHRATKGRRTFTAIDLFAGCGGLTLALKQAGFRVLAAVELDDSAVETYEVNHSNVTVKRGDIRKLSPLKLRRELGLQVGSLDLLAGCPPCQGFSALRTLNGAKESADQRNRLIYQNAPLCSGL
jgi:DNA (cytosine-5)-methyltransferase 1